MELRKRNGVRGLMRMNSDNQYDDGDDDDEKANEKGKGRKQG